MMRRARRPIAARDGHARHRYGALSIGQHDAHGASAAPGHRRRLIDIRRIVGFANLPRAGQPLIGSIMDASTKACTLHERDAAGLLEAGLALSQRIRPGHQPRAGWCPRLAPDMRGGPAGSSTPRCRGMTAMRVTPWTRRSRR